MAEQMNHIASLFGNWPETIIWSCLEGTMGQVYVDDSQSPQSALALYGRQSFFVFLAGQPHRDLPKICEGKDMILVPQNQNWSDLIEGTYGDGIRSFTRYATKKDTEFDLGHLQKLVDDLPESSIERAVFALPEKVRKKVQDELAQALGFVHVTLAEAVGIEAIFGFAL